MGVKGGRKGGRKGKERPDRREERRREGGREKREQIEGEREEGGQVTLYSYMLVTCGLTSFIVWRSMGNLMTL